MDHQDIKELAESLADENSDRHNNAWQAYYHGILKGVEIAENLEQAVDILKKQKNKRDLN